MEGAYYLVDTTLWGEQQSGQSAERDGYRLNARKERCQGTESAEIGYNILVNHRHAREREPSALR